MNADQINLRINQLIDILTNSNSIKTAGNRSDIAVALICNVIIGLGVYIDIHDNNHFGYNTIHYYVGMSPKECADLITANPKDAGNKGIYAIINIRINGGTHGSALHIFNIKTYKNSLGVALANTITSIAISMNCLELSYFELAYFT